MRLVGGGGTLCKDDSACRQTLPPPPWPPFQEGDCLQGAGPSPPPPLGVLLLHAGACEATSAKAIKALAQGHKESEADTTHFSK